MGLRKLVKEIDDILKNGDIVENYEDLKKLGLLVTKAKIKNTNFTLNFEESSEKIRLNMNTNALYSNLYAYVMNKPLKYLRIKLGLMLLNKQYDSMEKIVNTFKDNMSKLSNEKIEKNITIDEQIFNFSIPLLSQRDLEKILPTITEIAKKVSIDSINKLSEEKNYIEDFTFKNLSYGNIDGCVFYLKNAHAKEYIESLGGKIEKLNDKCLVLSGRISLFSYTCMKIESKKIADLCKKKEYMARVSSEDLSKMIEKIMDDDNYKVNKM